MDEYVNDDALGIAIEAGAVKVCRFHNEVTINQGDEEANRRAYAIATNKIKRGEMDYERKDLLDAVKDAIDMSADECPVCESHRYD